MEVVDIGSQEGANDWDGLNQLLEAVNETIWSSGPWIGHACDDCRKPVDVGDDDELVIQAAVIDGNTATRSGALVAPKPAYVLGGCQPR